MVTEPGLIASAGTTTMITHLSARPLKLSIGARDELASEH